MIIKKIPHNELDNKILCSFCDWYAQYEILNAMCEEYDSHIYCHVIVRLCVEHLKTIQKWEEK